MAGTKEGGAAAAATNKEKYGADFYEKIGSKGGRNGRTGGFFGNSELASKSGSVGGKRSKKGHRFIKETENHLVYFDKKLQKIVRFPKSS